MTEEIEVNAKGGAGTKLKGWYHRVCARALRTVAEVFAEGGTKYAVDNWRAVTVEEHLNHAITHAYNYLEIEQQYPAPDVRAAAQKFKHEELAHFACRAIMALAVHLQDSHVADVVPRGLTVKAQAAVHIEAHPQPHPIWLTDNGQPVAR